MPAAAVALLSAFVFGSADFLGGLAAKRLRSIVATSVAALAGLVLLVALYPMLGGAWHPADVAWGALSGVFGAVSIALLYACLAVGPMSILSPLTAIVSAVVPMLWGLLVDGEQLGALSWVGLGLALVAVVLVGFIPGQKVVRPSGRGLLMATGSGAAIGGFMITINQTAHDSGIVPLIANRAANGVITAIVVVVLVAAAVRRGQPARAALTPQAGQPAATPTGHADLEHPTGAVTVIAPVRIPVSAWWFAIACGAVDSTANAIMLGALRLGDLAVVSALVAMYPAGTIVLAAVVLHERVAAVQWVGLALALGAGMLLAVA